MVVLVIYPINLKNYITYGGIFHHMYHWPDHWQYVLSNLGFHSLGGSECLKNYESRIMNYAILFDWEKQSRRLSNGLQVYFVPLIWGVGIFTL